MKRISVVFAVATLTTCGAWAQGGASAQTGAQTNASAAATAEANSHAAQLAEGTTFQTELSHSLDAHKNNVGDAVTAKTTQDVKSNGKVVLPKGTKVMGHVTEVKAKSGSDANSTMGIVFDRAELKGGQEMPLHVGIQAIAAAQNSAMADTGAGDAMAMGSASGMGGGAVGGSGGMARTGGGLVGGVSSTAGGAVGSTAGTAGSTAGGAIGSTGRVATGANGAVGGVASGARLNSSTQGVIGLQGLSLNTTSSNTTEGSLITGTGRNVHLDGGTQMMLRAGPQGQ
jgi:hypothetical protein